MLQKTFKNGLLSRSICQKWFKRFKEGPSPTADDPRSGRSTVLTDNHHHGFLFTGGILSIVNFFLEVRQLIVLVTLTFWNIFIKVWKRRRQRSRQAESGYYSTTTPLCILRSSFSIFARKMQCQSLSSLLTHQIWLQQISFTLKNEKTNEKRFDDIEDIKKKNLQRFARGSCCNRLDDGKSVLPIQGEYIKGAVQFCTF